jgi:hypothetical protein
MALGTYPTPNGSNLVTFIIDYRVGGMGNAITAHILYACNQVDLSLESFFSPTGDAHSIRKVWQARDDLRPWHVEEHPDQLPPDSSVILEVKTSAKFKLLELKMGYNKYLLEEPNSDNVLKFYRIDKQNIDHGALWQDFYNNVKDPAWPECNSKEHIKHLPSNIQEEILTRYQPPDTSVNVRNLFNLLTISFYDHFTVAENHQSLYGGKVVLLDHYLTGNVDSIKQSIIDTLKWTWSDSKSNEFYEYLFRNNAKYLSWFKTIQDSIDNIINDRPVGDKHLNDWEKTAIIASTCKHYCVHPEILPWDEIHTENFDIKLIKFFKENYAKTI